jgi:membrane-associated phospholipid phosphatase
VKFCTAVAWFTLALFVAVKPGAAADPPDPADNRDLIYYPGDTERVKPLARKLAGNFLLDQKEIWTSPFRMNRDDAGWWLLFGGDTAALIATDNRSSTIFENSRTQVVAGIDISKTGAAYTLIPVTAAFYATGVFVDNAKARETGVLGAEAMLDSVVLSSVLKVIASRNRPDAPTGAGHFFSGGGSFPSGHATSSWALASVVAHEYSHTRIVPVLAYGLASLVSGARFAARQHYASDIVFGAASGWFIGTYVYDTHKLHEGHRHSPISGITPEIQPSTRTYAITLNFSR